MSGIPQYKRRRTNRVNIGGIPVGSDFPVRIQSMANTHTADVRGSVAQCIRMIQAGADYVRFTVPSLADVTAFAAIKHTLVGMGLQTPVIADVHFNPEIALRVADYADKVRINPGNFAAGMLVPLIVKCRIRGVALRIGVNHGSLSERIMSDFGDTPAGMVESAMEFLRVCKEHHFDQVVVSMKASNVRIMVHSTRLLAMKMEEENMTFPLHLGVTEAGEGEDGRIKSAVGIGTLLADGLGDTIRVSLTEEPEKEIPVARKLVDSAGTLSGAGEGIPPWMPLFPGYQIDFSRRKTRPTLNIGGNHPPLVIGSDRMDERTSLVTLTASDITEARLKEITADPDTVMVYCPENTNVQAELKNLRARLQETGCDTPVIFKLSLQENHAEDFMLRCAAALGGAFLDGFGDGIWLENAFPLPGDLVNRTAFGILQACRARMFKTEYIACPSCGRTQFNLMETLARIKAVTSHLKGLKIGVMGCIVNGPGEMADADYGYVGAGKGKITLYKSREVIKKGIPEADAVDELVRLIREYGDWTDP